MYVKLYLALCLQLFFLPGKAQAPIGKIKFAGLERTKASYLSQFLDIKEGDLFDSVALKANQLRLNNITTIGSVSSSVADSSGVAIIIFECEEMVNVLPIFGLGQTDDNLWFRVGAEDLNLGGKGHELFVYYQFYDEHSFFLKYRLNRVKRSNWSVAGSLVKWATEEPLVLAGVRRYFAYDNYSGGLSAVRHLSFRTSLEGGISLLNESYLERMPQNDDTPITFSRKGALLKLVLLNDFLNYDEFCIDGFRQQLHAETIKGLENGDTFLVFFNDLELFRRLSPAANLAVRVRVGLSTNSIAPFAPFVLDSFVNIRGIGNRVDRGTGVAVSNVEYRHTLLDFKKVAMQGVAFADFGVWRQPGGSLGDFKDVENMKAFYGLGTRLIYKKGFDTLLRIDYGINYRVEGGLVIGIGQYF